MNSQHPCLYLLTLCLFLLPTMLVHASERAPWWQHAVFYEIYPRSFKDSNGDGIGDLNGITQKLDYLASLGVDAIWITPFYPSPQVDFGYDVSDYENIDPQFGTLADFDRLVAAAHKRGIRIIVDYVLNHTSDQHPFFVASRSSRTSPYRDWYIWRDGKNNGPPNNWSSSFGPIAWTLDPKTNQYYYHRFYSEQPDLNWHNPEVEKRMFQTVRFWLDRGVDGFRLDAVNYLFEDPQFRDNPVLPELRPGSTTEHLQELKYNRDLPELHEVMMRLRKFTDNYDPNRVLIGEAYVPQWDVLMQYYGPNNNELQLPFNFFLVMGKVRTSLDATAFRSVINDSEKALKGRWTTYVLSNHDIPRAYDRYGDGRNNDTIAKLFATMLLTLRGSPFLYYGEEIGMVTTEPKTIGEVRDPVGKRYWPANKGRDGERTPMQWDQTRHAGFTTGEPWLKVPPSASERNVATAGKDPNSILNFYRSLIRLRRKSSALLDGDYVSVGDDPHIFAYRRRSSTQTMLVALNMSNEKKTFAVNGRIVLSNISSRKNEVVTEQLQLAPFEAVILDEPQKGTKGTNYLNPDLPIDKRVDDLVSRLTLEEKISQMMNKSAAIDRLGIPAYDWWNEALHGVAYAGTATVFPQAIGLGATWNEELIHRIATAISDEARAKYNDAIANNQRKRFYGLTFWSPNINIFRDPRWGRGQETYGEDPFLTSRLGVAFVRGMQGDDPRYLKTISTPKHYAVHSGPESERHIFNAKPSIRDLEETYLPAFRATVREAKAGSIMCAYNSVDGEPVCASKRMLDEILRAQWGFDGYVVSDCDAIADIYKHHHFAKTEEEGVAAGVKAGTDLTCGYEYRALLPAIKQGLISESEIDTAVKRLFKARFRLGMFDPPEVVPFSKIPFAVNDSAANRELARKAAQESIVLLKNENNILPLKKDLNTIAVIGPNADSLDVLLGNYNGIPSKWVTPLAGIKQKVSSNTRVLSALGTGLTGEIVLPVPADAIFSPNDPNVHGMKGEYFNNKDLQGEPVVTRTDEQVNFDWLTNSPVPQLNTDNFSVRWTGQIVPPASGVYQLGMRSDDGVRVYLDDKLFIDDWRDRSARTVTAPIQLEAGRRYKIKIEYYERYAAATAKLVWTPQQIEKTLWDEAVDKAKQADVVIMALGLSPSLEGEEMEVKVKGFSGGDRTDLNLPEAQEKLLKAVVATGKPVVLVLLNGSALAINWANNHVPGIIEAWYPGEEGGSAIADVLFDDYNPGGRLPVTFYKSTDDLPPFRDYNMEGKTYRYYKGEPLYPFGHGLSYTNFTYSNLKVPKRVKVTDKIEISVDVQNAGSRGGDEVVQLYVTDVAASAPVPIRALKGVKRFYLAPGEKRSLTFTLTPRDLTLIDNRGKRVLEPGEFRISVGGKQPGLAADAKTTQVLTNSFIVVGRTTEIP